MNRYIQFECLTTTDVLFTFKMKEANCCRDSKVRLYLAEKQARKIIRNKELSGQLFSITMLPLPPKTPINPTLPW
ncbi:MAG: hypothetical protein M1429_02655 [Patescibacteria group bacterium]|nr:hypothetical protein [Patescibacteria group bacterium]